MILSLEQSVPAHRRPHFKRYFVCTIGCITTLYIRLVNGYCAQSLLFELFSQNKLKLQLFLPFFQFRSQRIPVVRSRNERHHNFKSLIGGFQFHRFCPLGQIISLHQFIFLISNHALPCNKNASKKICM